MNKQNLTKGEKGVSRRLMGILSLIIGLVMAVFSGFSWYNPESPVIWAVFSAGFILLGIGNITDIWKK